MAIGNGLDHRRGLARFRSTAKMLSPKHWQDPHSVSLHRTLEPHSVYHTDSKHEEELGRRLPNLHPKC